MAEAAVYALRHVNVVASGSPAPICPGLGLDCDSLCWADGLAQLAGNASLLAGGIATEGMLTAKASTEGALLKRVVDGGRLSEQVSQNNGSSCRDAVWELVLPLIQSQIHANL